ncbi:hypothetical protein ACE14D_15790, partial [Streptomyces sp. Act-28]
MSGSPAPVHLDALGPDGPYRTRTREVVRDVTGRPVAELSTVPRLYVRRCLAALRRARTLPLDERIPALAEAGRLFAGATVGGMTVEEYEHAVARVSGLPVSLVRESTHTVATGLAGAERVARPGPPRGRGVIKNPTPPGPRCNRGVGLVGYIKNK